MVEWVKYSSYGSPFGLPGGDADSSGNTDSTDTSQIQTWINGSAYDVRGDINLNGVVNSSDKTTVTNNYVDTTLGWNNLSAIGGVGNRKGYAGYEWESQTGGYHVRHRYLRPDLGRWTQRDPLGYVDGGNMYEYVQSSPGTATDELGLVGFRLPAGFTGQCCMCTGVFAQACLCLRIETHLTAQPCDCGPGLLPGVLITQTTCASFFVKMGIGDNTKCNGTGFDKPFDPNIGGNLGEGSWLLPPCPTEVTCKGQACFTFKIDITVASLECRICGTGQGESGCRWKHSLDWGSIWRRLKKREVFDVDTGGQICVTCKTGLCQGGIIA